MTRIGFLYPSREDARFDIEYYIKKHMPWSISLLKVHPGFKGVSVERGMRGADTGVGPPYVAVWPFSF